MNKCRAMLIDDHPGYRGFLRRCLSRHPFIEVVGESGSAEEAWPEIARLSPDLLTVDIHLPGENGFEFVRKLRDQYSGINAIFISFDGSPACRKTAEKMRCFYLSKESILEDLDPILEGLRPRTATAGGGADFPDDRSGQGG